MVLENLNDSDINTLRELLKSSGRAAPDRRRSLCIKIGINEGDFSNLLTLPEDNFVVELIHLLKKRKLVKVIYNLAHELKSSFQGGEYASLLDQILHKLDPTYTPSIDNPTFTNTELTKQENPPQNKPRPFPHPPNILFLRRLVIISSIIILVLIVLRFFGLLESLELKNFDILMKLRFKREPEDSRIVIIAITDQDIRYEDSRNEQGLGSSLRDPSLRKLLDILEKYHPRLIGLDFYRGFPSNTKDPNLENQLYQKN